ncbi:MAG: hypothetical protein RLZZ323_1448 [Bacteroidota bacterium]|jgi:hypothetical protein
MRKKEVIRKRHSNRVYPPKFCLKPECNEEFVPTDARQIYCCRQHQIDASNDRRKSVNSYELEFNKAAKNNRQTLFKVSNSDLYRKSGYVHHAVLKYLSYDFDIFHSIIINEDSGVEVKFCFEFGLFLFDVEKNLFKIVKKNTHEI